MTVVYEKYGITVHHGDCLDILPTLADVSVDSVVTDPPYELAFMGRSWDSSGIAFNPQVWRECLRVLKPGGHLLAFGGSRTWHRLAVAIEDAGFELRDSIAWLYGNGFPKSLDVSKAIDKAAGAEREFVRRTAAAQRWAGWGTGIKPAFEPIVVARKPLAGTVVANVLAHGTGALNIDGCRTGGPPRTTHVDGNRQGSAPQPKAWGAETGHRTPGAAGRWPANVVLDDEAAAALDAETADKSADKSAGGHARRNSALSGDVYATQSARVTSGYDDAGGASRFFPTFRWDAKAPASERPKVNGVAHPTVKPLALMRWLVRLVTPPAGLVLDPFLGSGTTAQAARAEGFRCVGIEREEAHLALIRARLDARPPTAANAKPAAEPLNLLDLLDTDGAA